MFAFLNRRLERMYFILKIKRTMEKIVKDGAMTFVFAKALRLQIHAVKSFDFTGKGF